LCSSRSSFVLSTQLFFCERVSFGFKDTYHNKFLEMGRGPGRPRKSSPRYQPSATAALAARASDQQSKQQKQEISNPDQWIEPPLPPWRPSCQQVYPTNERNVSTALMQPLGKLPTKQQMVKGTTTTTTGRRPGRPPLNKTRATNTPSAPPSRVATP